MDTWERHGRVTQQLRNSPSKLTATIYSRMIYWEKEVKVESNAECKSLISITMDSLHFYSWHTTIMNAQSQPQSLSKCCSSNSHRMSLNHKNSCTMRLACRTHIKVILAGELGNKISSHKPKNVSTTPCSIECTSKPCTENRSTHSKTDSTSLATATIFRYLKMNTNIPFLPIVIILERTII